MIRNTGQLRPIAARRPCPSGEDWRAGWNIALGLVFSIAGDIRDRSGVKSVAFDCDRQRPSRASQSARVARGKRMLTLIELGVSSADVASRMGLPEQVVVERVQKARDHR